MNAKHIATATVVTLLGAHGQAFAIVQAPHDAAHNVTCNSCHIKSGALADPAHLIAGTATAGAATSLTDGAATWTASIWVDGVVTFTSGANLGQFRTITANTTTTLGWTDVLPAPVAAGDTYTVNKVTYDDIELKCKSCHNPAGAAASHPDAGLHLTMGKPIGCGKCHEPHNVDPNSGWSGGGGANLIRNDVRLPTGGTSPIVYSPGMLTNGAAGNGICQTCHTQTAYYRKDGSRLGHNAGQNCTTCHSHGEGFGGQSTEATGSAHFDGTAEAWGSHPSSQACLRCHTDGGFQDYLGVDGKANFLSGSFNTDATSAAAGPMTCQSCHNAVSDPLGTGLSSVLFVSLRRVDGLDKATALCSQCHQGRESTASVNSKIATSVLSASRGLGIASVSASAAGTTTTLVKSGFTANQYTGYALLVTNGARNGAIATVTGNDTTTITFTPALTSATASGDSATLWPTATGGGADTASGSGIRGVSLIDANRSWTANQWVDYWLYIQTGVNAGMYRKILSNDATTLVVAPADISSTVNLPFPALITAGTYYQILVKEDTSVLDAVAAGVSFSNVHYLPASAILHGADATVGYQYPSNTNGRYVGKNLHGVSQDSCTSCHSPHSLELTVTADTCGRCHLNEAGRPVTSLAELEETRQFGFTGDIDGDGNSSESLKAEIDGLALVLYGTLVSYGNLTLGGSQHPICYSATANPYFFKDNGTGGGVAGDGICQTGETASTNAYGVSGSGWFTPRMLRAAFNYQVYVKEPGAWAHNPRYMIELLYDSIVDMNAGIVALGGTAVPFAGYRSFPSHFGGATATARAGGEQYRHWDATKTGMVDAACAQCHGGQQGLQNYLANPLTNATPTPVQGMECTACHTPNATDGDMSRLRSIASVRFPPRPGTGVTLVTKTAAEFGDPLDPICATCHSARENKSSIDTKNGSKLDTDWTVGFTNLHYFGAAATFFGTETKVGYEFTGKTYAGKKQHHGATGSCMECHDPVRSRHTFEVAEVTAACATCHISTAYTGYRASRRAGVDYDGDGTVEELRTELDGIAARLLAQMQGYVISAGSPNGAICYSGSTYPYFLKDTNGNGACDAGETTGYTMNPTLAKAAYNYQFYAKEPGAWAHNFDYMAELLIDSIQALGGNVASLTRP